MATEAEANARVIADRVVAGGLLPIATGGDGGGSIRIPAGFNGLVGLKTTFGRVPLGPNTQYGNLTVTTGCMSRSVRDTAPLADVARLMARYSAEAVPVLDDLGRLVGIVTGSDLVRWWADEAAARP